MEPSLRGEVTNVNGPEFHLADELAAERVRDSLRALDRDQLVALATQDGPSREAAMRRSAARALAAITRGIGSMVRRLDECVAEDLGRALNPTE